jgi:N-acetylglutamate synthase-like GNAT family acetyltransferase
MANHGRLPKGVVLRNHFEPGDLGAIISLHGKYYGKAYGWNHTFEAYVAEPLSQFARAHDKRESIWIVEREGEVAGCIAIVLAATGKAQLRWFLLIPELRGYGLGRRLITEALDFCREQGYHSVYLWSAAQLLPAIELYRSVGFRLTDEVTHKLWGSTITEQRYELAL